MLFCSRFLSTGSTYAALQHEFLIPHNTISGIVAETCEAIWNMLKTREMPEPTQERWSEIADTFFAKTQFPNCVGAIDGKHIRCIKPKLSGSLFFNYKKYFSVVLMALSDANCCFTAIDVGAYGQEGDATVFRDSPLGQKLYSGQLNLPPPQCLPNTSSDPQPFVVVGDEAFKLHTNLLRPFPSRNLDAKKRIFNYRLSRCRRNVECAFGILANKWRVFHTPIQVSPENIDKIIKACCVLHNFVRRRDGVNYEDGEAYPSTMGEVQSFGIGGFVLQPAIETRNYFADYFVGPGAVSFQSQYNY